MLSCAAWERGGGLAQYAQIFFFFFFLHNQQVSIYLMLKVTAKFSIKKSQKDRKFLDSTKLAKA